MSDFTTLNIKKLVSLCFGFALIFLSSSAFALDESYEVYEKDGDYYLKTDPNWIPIAGSVFIVVPTYAEGEILKLVKEGGLWSVEEITANEFSSISPALVEDAVVSYTDLDGNGLADISVTLGSAAGDELVQLIANSGGGSFYARNEAPSVETPVAPSLAGLPPQDNASARVGTLAGEFRVDESGSATYQIPIDIIAGPGGIKPQVLVSYNSTSGHSNMGIGWSLNATSVISRCRQTFETDGIDLTISGDIEDRFCLNGQRLILVSGQYGQSGSEYRTEIDSQTRISASGTSGNGPLSFTVEQADGSTSYYGSDAKSRLKKSDQTVLFWYLSKIEDNVGNIIQYDYYNGEFGVNEVAVKEITTGSSTIEFLYDSNPSNPSILPRSFYVSDTNLQQTARLDEIKLYQDTVSYGNYIFSYEVATEAVFDSDNNAPLRLASIENCDGGSICKEPISFNWSSSTLRNTVWYADEVDYSSLAGEYYRSIPVDVNADGFDDVILVMKSGDTFKVYISYNEEGASFTTPQNLTQSVNTNNSFEMFPLDIDADGQVELVIPYGYSSGTPAWYYYDFSSRRLHALGHDVDRTAVYNKWMDVNADGFPDLIYENQTLGSLTLYINDNGTLSAPYEVDTRERLFTCDDEHPIGKKQIILEKNSIVADFNGDGRGDVTAKIVYSCTKARGATIQTQFWNAFNFILNETTNAYELAALLDENSQIPLSSGYEVKTVYGDFNGDGLTDILVKNGYNGSDGWNLYQSHSSTIELVDSQVLKYDNGSIVKGDEIVNTSVIDVNQDGLGDIVYQKKSDGDWYYHLFDGSIFQTPVKLYSALYDEYRYVSYLANFDGDSDLDFMRADIQSETIRPYYGTSGALNNRNLLRSIDYGYGLSTTISYKRLNDPSVYTKGTGASDFIYGAGSPVFDLISSALVVSEVLSSAPGYAGTVYESDNTLSVEYFYEGLRAQAGGRGMLGFEKLTTYDPQTDVTSETRYRQDFPFTGMPLASVSYMGAPDNGLDEDGDKLVPDSITLSYAKSTYDKKTFKGGRVVYPYLTKSEDYSYALNDAGTSSFEIAHTVTDNTYQTYSDNHANLTKVTVKTYDSNSTQKGSVVTTNSYGSESVADWWLGRVTSTSVTHSKADSFPNNNITRQSSFDYYSSGAFAGMLEYERISGPNNASSLSTRYCYDSFGNVKQKIQFDGMGTKDCSASDVDTDTTLTTVFRREWQIYDGNGQFVDESGNDKFTLNTVVDRNAAGQVTKSTDINGVVSRFAYDSFGVLYAQSNSAGGYTRVHRRLASNLWGGTPAISEPFEYAERTLTAGAPSIYKYYDQMGRQVATVKQGFDSNEWIHQYVRYDSYGRAVSQTIPIKVSGLSSAVFSWNLEATNTEYDVFGRIKSVTSADGSVSEITYNGLTTETSVTFDSLNQGMKTQAKTETKDVLGQTVAVNDGVNPLTYSYDATGNLTKVKDTSDVLVVNTYNSLGQKERMDDVDKGTWTYEYNALGELIKQTSANQVVTEFYRDSIGRTVFRKQGGEVTYYAFDNHQLEKECVTTSSTIDSTSCNSAAIPEKNYYYDTFGRVEQTITIVDDQFFFDSVTYDQYGRTFQQFDASGSFQGTRNHYNAQGYLFKVSEARSSGGGNPLVYQEIESMDAYGNVTSFKLNNGKTVTSKLYDSKTGYLTDILTSVNGSGLLQDNHYEFDAIGNLRSRTRDTLKSTSAYHEEAFKYDSLNRLTHINNVEQVRYFDNGNIKWKRGIGYYCYAGSGPHAVSGIGSSANCSNNTYDYDNNGNMLTGRGRDIDYSYFDKPLSIEAAGETTTFAYDTARRRFKRETTNDGEVTTTYYAGNVEKIYINGQYNKTIRYIPGGMSTTYSTGITKRHYALKDHLGSTDTLVDENGKIVDKLYFDAWGKQRSINKSDWEPTTQSLAAPSLISALDITQRGFTGHEGIVHAGIIHMNGRIYDPTLGRFLQADPFIQAPQNSQSYNRYSYVLNNPLSYTDPSGYFIDKIFKGFNKLLGDFAPFVAVALMFIPGVGQWAAASMWNAAVVGFAAGGIASGSLKGALIGAFTGAAFQQIGQHFNTKGIFNKTGNRYGYTLSGDKLHSFGGNLLTSGQITQQIASHAVVGGIAAELAGGKFGHGFFSAGVTKGIGGAYLPGGSDLTSGEIAKGTVVSAVIGGTASVISGGKFANGAQTGAFQFLFNQAQKFRFKMQSGSRKLMAVDVSRTFPKEEFGETESIGPFSAAAKVITPDIELISDNSYLRSLGRASTIVKFMDGIGTIDVTMVETVEYAENRYRYTFDKIDINTNQVIGVDYQFTTEIDYSQRFVIDSKLEFSNARYWWQN